MIRMFRELVFFLVALLLLGNGRLLSSLNLKYHQSETTSTCGEEFDWNTILPSPDLVWLNCYEGFSCTRLQVPLNYSDPEGPKAAIALIRQRSPLSLDSPSYAGPILYNPGGPGGSGVEFVWKIAPFMRKIVGPTFDLVGFDPRGVAFSTPRATFYKTEVEHLLWKAMGLENDVTGITREELAQKWAQFQVVGSRAQELNHAQYLQHITTENTARDMLYITRKYGWEKLKYQGYSYGTILGTTFATLFPDNIERMVLDGVGEAATYFSTLWHSNLRDTDKTMQAFFDSCSAAGSSACAFWKPTSSEIQADLEALYQNVRASPIPVHTSGLRYGTVGYSQLRSLVFQSLFSPYRSFPALAQGLADLREHRDGKNLLDLLGGGIAEDFDSQCAEYPLRHEIESLIAIACNDGTNVNGTLDAFLEYSKDFRDRTQWADAWEIIRVACAGYPKWDKTHFQGPIGATATSFPLLFIGNTADPAAPLWAAQDTQIRFPGSSLLTQDSPGHCSLSAPSTCTAQVVQAYMVNGTLPVEGAVCEVDKGIFEAVAETADAQMQVALDQKRSLNELSESLASLARWNFRKGPRSV
ncbi:TAP-like protein-domain-containing protein [Flagelloscypha sp. PMI_526]|nr:TAP-like protein-domain-containing protein [Flagelloscypha sp. PMI_526]